MSKSNPTGFRSGSGIIHMACECNVPYHRNDPGHMDRARNANMRKQIQGPKKSRCDLVLRDFSKKLGD